MPDQTVEALLPRTESKTQSEAHCIDLVLRVEDLLPAVTALREQRWGYLSAVTGLDIGGSPGGIDVLYHFCEGADVLTLRVRVPYDHAEVPTVCGIMPGARLYEQELRELFGVTVTGLPDTGYLFLPDDWKPGDYPMRKGAL